jgi:cell shape-determining protein MreC
MPLGLPRSRGRFVAILTLFCVSVILLDSRGSPALDRFRNSSREWFSPVRTAGRTVFRPFENVWHGIRDYDDLRREYEALRDAETRNQGVTIEAEARVQAYNELRALMGLLPCSSIPRTTAEVVGQPATNYERSLEINRGSDDGIVSGNPVVTPAGLIGRVGKVSRSHAFVQLLDDPTVYVTVNIVGTANYPKTPAEILAASAVAGGGIFPPTTTTTTTIDPLTTTTVAGTDRPSVFDPAAAPVEGAVTTTVPPTTTTTMAPAPTEQGGLHGNGRGKPLTVDFVRGMENVRVGDTVVTAGADASLFPGCIPVGRVSSVAARKGSSQLVVEVDPVADLDRVGLVTVILYDPSRREKSSTSTSIPGS